MKQQAIQYLVFDVHQATTVASLRNEQGKILMDATVPTEAKAILGLVKSAGPRVHVASRRERRPNGCTTYSSITPSG
jgi:hypothetical protein